MNEQIKKDRELLDNAYNDFLSICTRVAVENSRTGVEGAIAFERVKNYSDSLLAAQARVVQYEERQRVVEIINEQIQWLKENKEAPYEIDLLDDIKHRILSDNN